ncbi:SCO family protein [Caenispirillum bisanense]|uniref:SCO family protein n=1 Tax=Caenispirillum bisanense TaxID=414052 RepID=UPI0031D73388
MNKTLAIVAALAVVVVVGLGPRLAHWVGFPTGGASADGTTTGSTSAVAIGGPFTLVDGDGRTVTEQDFRGKWMVIYFGYTYCPDVCPTGLSSIGQAVDMLPEAQQDKVVPLFISVDPERDTPEVVGDYVGHFHPRMVGLTGSEEQVAAVAKEYKVYYKKVQDGDGPYLMDHSAIAYVMGPDGQFVRHFSHGVPPEDMAKALGELLAKGGAS